MSDVQPPAPGSSPGYPTGYPVRQQHSGALIALILGIIGVLGAGILSPVAWYLGADSRKQIDAEPGRYSNRDHAKAGEILGMVGTVLLLLFVLAFCAIFVVAFGIAGIAGSSS